MDGHLLLMLFRVVIGFIISLALLAVLFGCTDYVSDSSNSGGGTAGESHTITWQVWHHATFDVNYYAPEGGQAPLTCKLTSGSLPQDFSLEGCVIVGMPKNLSLGTTEYLSPPFTITIADSSDPVRTRSVDFVFKIMNPEIIFTTTQNNNCNVNEPCTVSLVENLEGGTAPYTFTQDSHATGSVPLGMTISLTDGILSGTPTVAGDYSFLLCAIDSVGDYSCNTTEVTVGETSTTSAEPRVPVVTIDSLKCEFERYTSNDNSPYLADYKITANGTISNADPGVIASISVSGAGSAVGPPTASCAPWNMILWANEHPDIGGTAINYVSEADCTQNGTSDASWQYSAEVNPSSWIAGLYVFTVSISAKDPEGQYLAGYSGGTKQTDVRCFN
ncbi:MAG: putative Ig domain-containing protein [Candidatus Diapherotrites archaeon]|nr:putative Ig domain-containing protein [Candidatus Diapherotrites archaeon]